MQTRLLSLAPMYMVAMVKQFKNERKLYNILAHIIFLYNPGSFLIASSLDTGGMIHRLDTLIWGKLMWRNNISLNLKTMPRLFKGG